ncbi:hypothetical protein ACNKHL_13135 [Shigella flexneri]
MQAANTGRPEDLCRTVFAPRSRYRDHQHPRLDKLDVLGKGEQVLAYPGTTLYSWKKPSNSWDANRTQ